MLFSIANGSSLRYRPREVFTSRAHRVMHWKLGILGVSLLVAAVPAAAQSSFKFDTQQLSGSWAESYSTDLACAPTNPRVKYEFSKDGTRLSLRFDRRQKELDGRDHIDATILASTERSVVIRYDDESRMHEDGRPAAWELTVVAPGVYRWRETSSPAGKVNIVVGVRCAS